MTLDSNLAELTTETLTAAIQATSSPFIITDHQRPDDPIVYANEAFLKLTGYEEAEVIGKNCRFLQGKETVKARVKELAQAVKKEQAARVQLLNYRKDGTPFWNDLVVSPVKNTKGVTTHFVGMQLDITDIMARTEDLQKIQADLKKTNQELEQFTYAASHDLQEPLRMVSSYLQLLQKRYLKSFDADGQLFMSYAIEGAERMQALINDLLTLSRVSSMGKSFKPISFNEIVNRACFNLKLSIDETKAQVVVDDLPTLPADNVQMVQLIQNLVSNALKYRKPNHIPRIHISAAQKGKHVIFSIQDNGIGIPVEYQQRVFAIFQRLHTREEYPGTGVGLAICSKIIERHNGRIWVESDGTSGATFKFELPMRREGA